jgi:hypothetical protein
MKSPPARARFFSFRGVFALLLGLTMGVFFHYLLYRLSLPSKPFIYVSF